MKDFVYLKDRKIYVKGECTLSGSILYMASVWIDMTLKPANYRLIKK